MKILVVEDDQTVARTLQILLSSYSYAVDVVGDGEAGLQMADAFTYDLMVLDVVLPRLDGISLCQQLRANGFQNPILLLTGRGEGHQKAIALNAGADDYVVKPFDSEELVARIQALLRRGGPTTQAILTWGNLSLDPNSHKVTYGTHLLSVTPKEYAILELFLRHPQKAFSASAILDHVWNSVDAPSEEAVRVHIKELRQKLKAAGAPKDWIKTTYQIGYRLNPLYSSALAKQVEDRPTLPQVAELTAVNEELRLALEQLRLTEAELHQKHQELEIAYQTIEHKRQQLQASRNELEVRLTERTAELVATIHSLQQQQDQWQALFDHALDAIVIADDQGYYVDANPAACELFGVSRAELLRSCLANFADPGLDVTPLWQQFLQQGQMSGEFCLHRPDGTMRETEFSAIANFIPNRHLSILRDISERKQAEANLRESERQLSTLMNNLPGYVYRVANDLNYTPEFISEGVFSVTEYRQEEYLTDQTITCGEEIHPEDVHRVWNLVQQAVEAHQPYECEYRITTKSGTQKWVWERGQGIYTPEGHLCFLEGFVTDITRRKQAEESLREREQQYHQILDSIADMVVVKQPGSRLVWANKAFRDYYGMTLEELNGMVDASFNSREHTLQYIKDDAYVFETGQTLEIPEEYVTRHDGVVRIFNTIKAPIYNESGQVVMLVGVCRDITDQKQAEAELRQRQEFLSSIYNGADQAVFVVDVDEANDFHYVSFNPIAERFAGISAEDVQGKTPEAAFGTSIGTTFRQNYHRCLQAGTSTSYEEQIVFEDHILWTLTTLSPLRNEPGDIYRIVGTAIDITERKQLEISLQASEARLSQILDSAITSIASFRVFDNQDWEYDYFSTGCETLFGYTVQELMADKTLWLSRVFPADQETVLRPLFQEFFAGHQATAEFRFYHKDGSIRWISSSHASQQIADHCWRVTVVNHDITDRKRLEAERQQTEAAIQKSEEQLRLALDLTHIGSWDWQIDTNAITWNTNHYRLFDYQPGAVEPSYQLWRNRIHPDDVVRVEQELTLALETQTDYEVEYRLMLEDGSIHWILGKGRGIYDQSGQALRMIGVSFDITDRKQAELALQQQILREQLIADISQDVRQSLDLKEVLSRTGERVRALLNTDRVVIFRFRSDRQGEVIMESVGAGWTPLLSTKLYDPCFSEHYAEPYRQGRISTIADVDREKLAPCYLELLQQFQVKANLVVPILQGESLWGLLIAHHCTAPRQWQPAEIDLLRQLATQVEIAIQQSELYQQTRLELLERKRMQTVLEQSEERFRTLSAAAPVGICQTNADGICLYTNACWQEMSGLSFEDSLGDGWLRAIHPQDRQAILVAWEAYLQGGSEQLPEFRLLTPEGKVRWIAGKVATMKSASGEVIGYVGIDEDITERKLAERKIREQAALLDIASDAIFVCDLDYQILYWNQGAERLYGWLAAEAIGQKVGQLLQSEATQVASIRQTLLEQGEGRGEIRKVTKTGREVMIEVRWTLVRDEAGQPKFILSVETDITEKKQLEAQFYRAQRLESIGTLASGIAHDLNNVFTPILALSHLLRLKLNNLDARSQEVLELLSNSAERGADLVKQILTFAGGSDGKRIPLQVGHLVDEIANIAQQTFPRSITISRDIPSQSLWLVSADPTHLHQVLMNLCVNARDAMLDGGELMLSIQNFYVDERFAQLHLDAQVGHYVVITIADTGMGIPPKLLDRIFEPFFTTKALGQGTGLGLSTALGIVKSYGGFMEVQSQSGAGSQFKVYLPAIETAIPASEPLPSLPQGQGALILLVDDETVILHSTQAILEAYDYRVLTACNGPAAISTYAEHQDEIQVVLMDMMMPDMDGPTLVQALQTMNPQVKVVATSGLAENYRQSLQSLGITTLLTKPFTVADLLHSIHLQQSPHS